MSMTARMVFDILLTCLEADNGFEMEPTEQQIEQALPHIQAMMEAGFFREEENPSDLESSFWEFAAGEATEREVFFKDAPALEFRALDRIFEEIFSAA